MHFSLERIQRFVDQIVTKSNCQDCNDILRLNHYIWLSIIAIPLSFIFITKNILLEHYNIAITVACFLVFIFSCLFIIPKVKSLNVIYHTNNCVFMAMLLLVSNYGNIPEGQILWCYVYPLLSIFLFGHRIGVKWSLFLLVAVITSLQFNTTIQINQHFEFEVRFCIIYLTVLSITSWLEYSRSRYIETVRKQRYKLETERERLSEEVNRRTQLEEQLNKLANRDDLTGLFNRRYFLSKAKEMLTQSQRYNTVLAMAIIDIDNFKNINDSFGHPTGDEVLKRLAKEYKQFFRESDIYGRIGGEEFAILLPQSSTNEALKTMDKFRQKISEQHYLFNGNTINITISIGLAVTSNNLTSIDELYSIADKALYQAKNNGRNQTLFEK
ncbi:GGDEF domain-containing protein [Psychromonas sp. PT13]|uniref:GGDEF domain-containing protein n=1 Tax=Psychromonas sp. PT13 TaxID=3439547 RepID=UPI003EBC5794